MCTLPNVKQFRPAGVHRSPQVAPIETGVSGTDTFSTSVQGHTTVVMMVSSDNVSHTVDDGHAMPHFFLQFEFVLVQVCTFPWVIQSRPASVHG